MSRFVPVPLFAAAAVATWTLLSASAAVAHATSQPPLPRPTQPTVSHGGGLDQSGCHHDRKRGGYHCHR